MVHVFNGFIVVVLFFTDLLDYFNIVSDLFSTRMLFMLIAGGDASAGCRFVVVTYCDEASVLF